MTAPTANSNGRVDISSSVAEAAVASNASANARSGGRFADWSRRGGCGGNGGGRGGYGGGMGGYGGCSRKQRREDRSAAFNNMAAMATQFFGGVASSPTAAVTEVPIVVCCYLPFVMFSCF